MFFFASAAASSAYLVVSESFPVEVRALSIAFFYALGTAIGGVGAPWLFGALIGTGEPAAIAWGYALGAILMLTAAAVALRLGVAAERKPLEEVARPLSSVDLRRLGTAPRSTQVPSHAARSALSCVRSASRVYIMWPAS